MVMAEQAERKSARAAYTIRPVASSDAGGTARLIRTVMPEFGASGPGYAIMDPEVDDMHASYTAHGERAAYWVVVRNEDSVIVGGGGFAPLVGGDEATCELRKMYLYPELRGLGIGSELLALCIDGAARAGFRRMYLETLAKMKGAQALYEKNGFERIPCAKGNTGHSGCDTYYERSLP
jgi:putative acetyltransferase